MVITSAEWRQVVTELQRHCDVRLDVVGSSTVLSGTATVRIGENER